MQLRGLVCVLLVSLVSADMIQRDVHEPGLGREIGDDNDYFVCLGDCAITLNRCKEAFCKPGVGYHCTLYSL